MIKKYSVAILLLALFIHCNPSQKVVESPMEIKEEMLDTLVVTAPKLDTSSVEPEESFELPVYRESYTRRNDLLHTFLDLSFDWEQQYVIGKAELSLSPVFYPMDKVVLDAKGFDIKSIRNNGESLDYTYDGSQIHINLDRAYAKDEVYVLYIDYVAKPNEGEVGSSAAITSEKGLFFINPLGDDPDKPQQIWTQGETENNSRWFPTIDKPNERCTQEIKLTVQDRFKTLSNGALISSRTLPNGMREDIWKQDKPHAPYLFMLAIGEFAVVEETWNGIPVTYYVEPEFGDHAKAIFNHTPEMLTFFSDLVDVDYPWDKYAQIVVRDYVSGAMENTSASIFGDFVQKTTEELIDNSNDFIVAHELIHHWFGDLVTCESWANLTMNEGFANYGEYLWFEYKYGIDEADFHRQNELYGYIGQTQNGGIHPLIHFEYADKEQMFDSHSYNKGGLVLHMLRSYMGDEAFFAGLNQYLTQNEYTAVEAHDLRLAMEDISGEDLNWFFNQWYFSQGHPILEYEYAYDDTEKTISLDIHQVQDPTLNPPIFILPMEIAVYYDNGSYDETMVRINQRSQTFSISVDREPTNVILDHQNDVLCIINEEKSDLAMLNQYKYAPNYLHRVNALRHFSMEDSPMRDELLNLALRDNHWSIRANALNGLSISGENRDQIIRIAKTDEHSAVRAASINLLAGDEVNHLELFENIFNGEKAPLVKSEVLLAIYGLDSIKGLQYAENLLEQAVGPMEDAVGEIIAYSGQEKYIPFFENKINSTDGFQVMGTINNYIGLLINIDPELLSDKVDFLRGISLNQEYGIYKRYSATKGLSDLKSFVGSLRQQSEVYNVLYKNITNIISEIKSNEANPQLKEAYMFIN